MITARTGLSAPASRADASTSSATASARRGDRRREEHDHRVHPRVGQHGRQDGRGRSRPSRRRACRPGSPRSPRPEAARPAPRVVSGPSAASSSPAASHASAQRIPSPPALVSTATLRPPRLGLGRRAARPRPRAPPASQRGSRPAWRKSASTAASEPARAAVCELAALRPLALVPLFRARIGLRRATRRASRPKRRGLPNDSTYMSTSAVVSSSSHHSSRSFVETSALFPIETNADRPRPRASAASSSATPSAPLCDEKPMFPARRRARGEGRVQARPGGRDAEAVRARSGAPRASARARAAAPGARIPRCRSPRSPPRSRRARARPRAAPAPPRRERPRPAARSRPRRPVSGSPRSSGTPARRRPARRRG